jgi:hypothetical protein
MGCLRWADRRRSVGFFRINIFCVRQSPFGKAF